MKKAVSLLMSVLMLLSLLAMPVYAAEDDGFNDGSFPSWECVHVYEAVVTEPTCEDEGFTTHTCTKCGDNYVTDETAALGHVYEDNADTECDVCGAEREIEDPDNSFNDGSFPSWECTHNYEKTSVTEPNCEDEGFTTYTCTKCSDSYEGDKVAALGHIYDDDADTTCNRCGAVREIIQEKPLGSAENPYYLAMPNSINTPDFQNIVLQPGESVYFQTPALKFTNWILTISGISGVENASADPNEELDVTFDPLTYGYKIVLSSGGNKFVVNNAFEEETIIELKLEEPLGSMDAPYVLADGANELAIPLEYTYYFMRYQALVAAKHTFTFSDSENYKYYYDVDGTPSTIDDWQPIDAEWTTTPSEGYIDLYLIAEPINDVRQFTVTVTPPKKGSEINPYSIWGNESLKAGASELGDGLWPIDPEGVNYGISMPIGCTLVVEGNGKLAVGQPVYETVYENEEDEVGHNVLKEVVISAEYTLKGSLELPITEEFFWMVLTSAEAGSVKMSLRFPLGDYDNPQVLKKGKNTLKVTDGIGYYASYTAEKDGVVVITPSSLLGLGYTDASNTTSENYDSVLYDYISKGYLNDDGVIEGASEDNVLKVDVKAGDVLLINTITEEYETDDGDYLWPENVVLYVCYESNHKVTAPTCTQDGKCATCGLPGKKAVGHKYDAGKVTKAATCKVTGTKTYTCSVCKGTKTETIAKSKTHTYTNACDKSCNVCGATRTTSHKYTNACDTSCNVCKATRTITHKYTTVTKAATATANGYTVKRCSVCKKETGKTTIYKASTIKLAKTAYTYNGKVQKPAVTIKDSKGKTIATSNYTVTYSSGLKNAGTYKVTVKFKGKYSGTKVLTYKINPINVSKCKISLSKTSYTYNGKAQKPTVTVKNASGTKLTTASYTVTYATGRKNVGTYKVTIKMKGNYTGTKVLTFKINPVKTTVSKVTAAKKKLTINVAKKTTQVTGYEIQYATNKSFKSAKTKTLSSYKKTSLSLTGLKAKTTYYIRVRTYKTVNGKKVYSAWSVVKTAKTK